MQRNNGAGGSLKNLIKIGLERFVVSFVVSIKKMVKITSLLTSTKLATMRFIKLIVDVNKSIFQTNHLFYNWPTSTSVS